MNRRGFLASLLGAVAAVAAKPLAVFAPAPGALVALPLVDAPGEVALVNLFALHREAFKEALGRWFMERCDEIAYRTLTDGLRALDRAPMMPRMESDIPSPDQRFG